MGIAMKLVIQIPAYNEQETLPVTLRELPRQVQGIDEVLVLVIDDGSTDQTAQVALDNGADMVVQHPTNKGLARSFITGLETSLALGADIIVNTDADNQYPGHYIADLVQPILLKRSEIVIGDRQVLTNKHFSPFKRFLEALGSWFVRKLSYTDVPDAPSGFRAYSRYAALRTQVYSGYSYTLETLIQAGHNRLRIEHLPIKTNATVRKSRLHKGLWDFIKRQTATILRAYVLFEPFKTFTLLSLPFLTVGAILILRFLYFYFTNQSGVARHVNSVTLGGVSALVGFLLLLLGLLSDAIKNNRRLLESLATEARDHAKITKADTAFLGMKLLRRK